MPSLTLGPLARDVARLEMQGKRPSEIAVTLGKSRQNISAARGSLKAHAKAILEDVAMLVEAGYLTNETIFDLDTLPRRLIVLGGGPIGCELSQAFRRFGSEVTMVERADQFLTREAGNFGLHAR